MSPSERQGVRVERRSTLAEARGIQGTVVVIDVLRAFTCAAMMFHYGIAELLLVATVEEALQIRNDDPAWLLAGEVNARKIPGFDLGNSPAEIMDKGMQYLHHRKVVLRSTSGVQGAVAVRQSASEIIVAAYSTASAVARYIRCREAGHGTVTLLGMGAEGRKKSIEDERCADYIEHLLTDKPYDHVLAIRDCHHDPNIAKILRGELPHLPKEDAVLCLQRDLFQFVMIGQAKGNSVAIRALQV